MCLSWCLLWESLPPPLKGCLFAKKEEGKQPPTTQTHNPKSRRDSPPWTLLSESEGARGGGDQPPSAVSWLILCECISFQSASLHHSQHAVTHGPSVYPHFLGEHGMMRHHKCILTVNIDLDGKMLKRDKYVLNWRSRGHYTADSSYILCVLCKSHLQIRYKGLKTKKNKRK